MIIVEQFDLSLLPQIDAEGKRFARTLEQFDAGGTPPPILLLKRRDGNYDIYDGLNRIAAARKNGITHLRAGVCDHVGEVVAERMKLGRNVAAYWAEKLSK